MRTLLIGYSTEKTFRHTMERMREFGVDIDVLDLARVAQPGLVVDIVDDPSALVVTIGDQRHDLGSYRAIYNRAYWTDLRSASRNAALSRLVRSIVAWLATCGGTVVNRPGCGASNCNKFFHGMALKQMGFRIPFTVVTGDPLQAGLLAQQGFDIVSKSCSSLKTRTTAMAQDDWQRLHALLDCPTLFQRRIRGDEVRVHWIGGRLFPERIATHRVDYRFADPGVPPNRHRDCEVPADIARLCDRYCTSESLVFAGFDFKIEADETWTVLEANPMPGYESYDRRQGHRIARALADLLTSNTATPPPPASTNTRTSWETRDTSPPLDYGTDIYDTSGDRDVQSTLFVGEERRPVCRPFFHAMHHDADAGRDSGTTGGR